jgi:hypothetical protein
MNIHAVFYHKSNLTHNLRFRTQIYDCRSNGKEVVSKRFALLLQNGESAYLSIDENPETCEFTAAENIVDLLAPTQGVEREEEKRQIEEANQSGILATVGALFLAVVMAANMPGDVVSATGM